MTGCVGITNGVDYTVWDPEHDTHIAANYSRDDLSGKKICKQDLLQRFGLLEELDRPLISDYLSVGQHKRVMTSSAKLRAK